MFLGERNVWAAARTVECFDDRKCDGEDCRLGGVAGWGGVALAQTLFFFVF